MGEPPTFYASLRRRARKAHRCCECQRRIVAGETYTVCEGVWEGRWDRFKVCGECADLRVRIEAEAYVHDELPAFGELYSYAHDGDFLCIVRGASTPTGVAPRLTLFGGAR